MLLLFIHVYKYKSWVFSLLMEIILVLCFLNYSLDCISHLLLICFWISYNHIHHLVFIKLAEYLLSFDMFVCFWLTVLYQIYCNLHVASLCVLAKHYSSFFQLTV